MQRREVLRWIGGTVGVAALAGASPERLFAVGHAMHDRLTPPPTGIGSVDCWFSTSTRIAR